MVFDSCMLRRYTTLCTARPMLLNRHANEIKYKSNCWETSSLSSSRPRWCRFRFHRCDGYSISIHCSSSNQKWINFHYLYVANSNRTPSSFIGSSFIHHSTEIKVGNLYVCNLRSVYQNDKWRVWTRASLLSFRFDFFLSSSVSPSTSQSSHFNFWPQIQSFIDSFIKYNGNVMSDIGG